MSSIKTTPDDKEIVFFIDKKQFKSELKEITASDLLSQYAKEEPAETTLVLKHGNELTKYENGSQLINLKNGMQFIVYHNGATTVSSYGPQQLVTELDELGFDPVITTDSNDNPFVIIRNYLIQLGKFAGRTIDLGIPAPSNYPQAVAASIHIRTSPQLYENSDSISKIRNITDSTLGPDWRYWSRNLNWQSQKNKDARRLMSQIAGVFNNA